MAKKEAKKAKPKSKTTSKAEPSKELTDQQLEQVAGGAFDAYLKLDGIKGETTQTAPTTVVFAPLTNPLFKR